MIECSDSSGFSIQMAVMMQRVKQLFIQLHVRHVIINAVNEFWTFPIQYLSKSFTYFPYDEWKRDKNCENSKNNIEIHCGQLANDQIQ